MAVCLSANLYIAEVGLEAIDRWLADQVLWERIPEAYCRWKVGTFIGLHPRSCPLVKDWLGLRFGSMGIANRLLTIRYIMVVFAYSRLV